MSSSPITITGNITQDPEMRFMPSGAGKLSFSVACSHFWTDQAGEKQEKTSFLNVVAWRNLAEDAANVLQKGMRVVVTGRLEQRSYEDKEGNNRSIVEISADDIALSCRGVESVVRRRRNQDGAAPKGGGQQRSGARSQQGRLNVDEDSEPF
jgi:single-strand DNA-binding protein